MNRHTPEPWHVCKPNSHLISDAHYMTVAEARQIVSGNLRTMKTEYVPGHKMQAANAERIVACVNACTGINPEAVPLMLEALKEALYALDNGNAERPEDSRYSHLWDIVFKATEPSPSS